MSEILLSILIPTVVGREEQYSRIIKKHFQITQLPHYQKDIEFNGGSYHLEKCTFQCCRGATDEELSSPHLHEKYPSVQFVSIKDNKELTIGEKREMLYKEATGTHSWMIDDDDDIAPNAIQLILEAIKSNPDVDCITFEENCMMNGKYYKSNHSLEYPDWYGDGSHLLADGFHYHRTPFYKDVIKTEIAKSVPFQHIRYGEDHLWSIDLKPKLTSEIHLDTEVYYYIYEPKEDFNTRYGLNK